MSRLAACEVCNAIWGKAGMVSNAGINGMIWGRELAESSRPFVSFFLFPCFADMMPSGVCMGLFAHRPASSSSTSGLMNMPENKRRLIVFMVGGMTRSEVCVCPWIYWLEGGFACALEPIILLQCSCIASDLGGSQLISCACLRRSAWLICSPSNSIERLSLARHRLIPRCSFFRYWAFCWDVAEGWLSLVCMCQWLSLVCVC